MPIQYPAPGYENTSSWFTSHLPKPLDQDSNPITIILSAKHDDILLKAFPWSVSKFAIDLSVES